MTLDDIEERAKKYYKMNYSVDFFIRKRIRYSRTL